MTNEPASESAPMLRVIRGGEPTDEEVAALVTVLASRSAASAPASASLRQPLSAWVASGLVKGARTKA
jgi:hypothetical protein